MEMKPLPVFWPNVDSTSVIYLLVWNRGESVVNVHHYHMWQTNRVWKGELFMPEPEELIGYLSAGEAKKGAVCVFDLVQ